MAKKATSTLGTYYIEVGVFADKASRKDKGVNNAELMFIHENGSPLRHIPPRPVLQMTIDYAENKLINGAVQQAFEMMYKKGNSAEFERELERFCMRLEAYAQDIIYSNDGRLVPNAPSTIRAKKDTNHPLFDTGQLARSIRCKLVKG